MKKHFGVTVYIIKDNQILFVDHKKMGKWLPPGGHVEANESPDDTAVREVKEETGLDIELTPNNNLTTHGEYNAT